MSNWSSYAAEIGADVCWKVWQVKDSLVVKNDLTLLSQLRTSMVRQKIQTTNVFWRFCEGRKRSLTFLQQFQNTVEPNFTTTSVNRAPAITGNFCQYRLKSIIFLLPQSSGHFAIHYCDKDVNAKSAVFPRKAATVETYKIFFNATPKVSTWIRASSSFDRGLIHC